MEAESLVRIDSSIDKLNTDTQKWLIGPDPI